MLAHGSRTPETARELAGLAEGIRAEHPQAAVLIAFLSLGEPDLPAAAERAIAAGAEEVRILPLFLFSGKHVLEDIPRLADRIRARHAGTRIVLLPAIGAHADFVGFAARAAGFPSHADPPPASGAAE